MLLASILFVIALAIIATDWVHRTVVVMTGAGILVATGILSQEEAIESVDMNTIGLLIGMMVIVVLTERTGIFEHIAIKAMRLTRGRPLAVVIAMVVVTAVLSAFLDNLTAILLVAPIGMIVAHKLGMEPVPVLILQIIASNIGGTATLIGDPPNIMIAGRTGLTFNEFLINLAPVAALTLTIVTALVYLIARRSFAVRHAATPIEDIYPDMELKQGRELWLPLGALVATVLGFFVHQQLHLEPATVALLGATALMLVSGGDVSGALKAIDWPTLFFFAGLFVMVGGLEHTGAIDQVARATDEAISGSRETQLLGIMWIAAAGSAVVDNIPFTAAMLPVVEHINTVDDDAHWWALALGACFGGNATIIAAAANVACQGVAERAGHPISFVRFLAWGLPTTIVSLLVASAYIALFHV